MTKYEMAERIAMSLERTGEGIKGISASVLTVALMNLRKDELDEPYRIYCESTHHGSWTNA
jgi:hypothetical protein